MNIENSNIEITPIKTPITNGLILYKIDILDIKRVLKNLEENIVSDILEQDALFKNESIDKTLQYDSNLYKQRQYEYSFLIKIVDELNKINKK